jgi:3-phosphoshikimate 1-carboxyvinyltransferase
MASAQVKSCVLLAGLYADGETSVTEPAPTRDHTERMLRGFGCRCESSRRASFCAVGPLRGCAHRGARGHLLRGLFPGRREHRPGSELLLTHVGVNPTRTGVLDILQAHGRGYQPLNEREVGGEPVADLLVRYAPLRGIEIPEALVPLAIDEFPVLFIAAACAEGRTVLRGARELRVKESDRIASMAEGLTTLGVHNEVLDDGIIVEGGEHRGRHHPHLPRSPYRHGVFRRRPARRAGDPHSRLRSRGDVLSRDSIPWPGASGCR